jgi:peptidoglycan/LPS O-acetylase OafA/YrhL
MTNALSAQARPMGYQPTLDGVRAFSVVAVILYHAGFCWLHGGFFGVEVFFVVSGFLITSLLVEERDRVGRVSLGQFWRRRWRRLLPALFTMMVVVGAWAAVWGTAEQHTQMRREFPWALGYLANWGQIFSQDSYWGAGSPSLFRHLWSLAVEEQWYVVWPLVFLLLARKPGRDRMLAVAIGLSAVGVMVGTAVAGAADWPARLWNPFRWQLQTVDHTNVLYLSTFSRSSGLLLGAAMAFCWRPWRREVTMPPARLRRATLGLVAFAAVAVLLASFAVGRVEETRTYAWLLPAVTVASAVLVGVVVHPAAGAARALFGWGPLVAVGKRSYGLYLWSWPISRICDAHTGSWWRFLLAMAITVPVSEACYRWIESPIRAGALARWWAGRRRWSVRASMAGSAVAAVAVVSLMGSFFASAAPTFDPSIDTANDVAFDIEAALPVPTTVAPPTTPPATSAADVSKPTTTLRPTTTTMAPTTTLPTLPRRMVIVGDSTAHSLAVNLPGGIDGWFTIGDGSLDGCSVYSDGTAVSSRPFTRSFDGCSGWEQRWARSAERMEAEVALVVIGAWDVFDVQLGDQLLVFGTPEADARIVAGVQLGIDALVAKGVQVALLEVPCMRPQDVRGQGVPPLPERGDDLRVAHLNDLLRDIAAANPDTTTFVAGPVQYCTDEAIATSRSYRWDGVHAYQPGAKLTFEAIAAALLSIEVPPR